jgi:DNA-directed RNA polymerase specialized sigma24 family protein
MTPVASSDSTRWTIIRGAAAGKPLDRAEFARRYAAIIRAYLGARWRQSPLLGELDDATQEAFLACFAADGPLAKADPDRPGGFRAYLYGIVRNVARGFERKWAQRRERPTGGSVDLEAFEGDDAPLSQVFDRAWAASLLRQAAARQARNAEGDERAKRRVELLRLRFRQDLPIRDIARLWGEPAARVHEEYRTARGEFLAALQEVVAEHQSGTPAEIEAECARLLDHLP